SPAEVFAAVTEEAARVLHLDSAHLVVYERDQTATVVGSWSLRRPPMPVGMRVPLEGDNIIGRVFRTQQPARIDDDASASGLVAEAVPPGDVFTAVAAEVAGLFGVPLVGLFRYEREGVATVIAGAGKVSPYLGKRWPCPAGDPGLVASLQRTGQPLRIDDYTQ